MNIKDLPVVRFVHKYNDYADPLDKVMDLYDPLDYEFYGSQICDCKTIINNVVTVISNRSSKEVSYPIILHSPRCVRAYKTNELVNNAHTFIDDGLPTFIMLGCAYIVGYLSGKYLKL